MPIRSLTDNNYFTRRWLKHMTLLRRNMRRQTATAARTLFHAVTFVCLCASLWRAPVPWLHRHIEVANSRSAAGAMDTLDRHLDEWHSGDELGESSVHLHFALLDDIVRGGGCPVSPDSDDDEPLVVEHLVPPGQSVVQADLSIQLADDWNVSDARFVVSPIRVAQRPTQDQFLGDYSASRRLLTLLCVAQC